MKHTLFLLACAAFLAGCNTTRTIMATYEQDVTGGAYLRAADTIQKKAEKKDKDELLWRLMTANARALGGDSPEAIRQFDLAEDIFAKNDSYSVYASQGQTVVSVLSNDRSFPYAGYGQDRIFCCMYKALNYAALGDMNAARTEFNRAYDHQENWLFERRKAIEAAEKDIEKNAKALEEEKNLDSGSHDSNVKTIASDDEFAAKMLKETGFDPRKSGNLRDIPERDYINAYLYHLCGVSRLLNGDPAKQYFKDAYRIHPENAILAQDLLDVTNGKKPSNMVWIYVEDGMAPTREEFRIDLPIGLIGSVGRYLDYVGIAFPRLVYRDKGAQVYSVTVGGATSNLLLLEDFDHLMKTEYDVYMSGAIKREIIRCVLKASIQVGLGLVADNMQSGTARAMVRLSQVAAAGISLATTSADLRCWTGLPKQVFVQRVPRPADGKLVVRGDSHQADVTLPEGNSIVWLRKTGSYAPFAVKVIAFK